jgi:biopolymer transport protein ExbD
MRFKRTVTSSSLPRYIDTIPLIGIFFLLLVFMAILLGVVVSQQGVKINLPKLITGQGLVYENVELIVNSADAIYLNGSLITQEELKKFFTQVSKRQFSLLIVSERKATLGTVMEICNLARSMGITQIRLISR